MDGPKLILVTRAMREAGAEALRLNHGLPDQFVAEAVYLAMHRASLPQPVEKT